MLHEARAGPARRTPDAHVQLGRHHHGRGRARSSGQCHILVQLLDTRPRFRMPALVHPPIFHLQAFFSGAVVSLRSHGSGGLVPLLYDPRLSRCWHISPLLTVTQSGLSQIVALDRAGPALFSSLHTLTLALCYVHIQAPYHVCWISWDAQCCSMTALDYCSNIRVSPRLPACCLYSAIRLCQAGYAQRSSPSGEHRRWSLASPSEANALVPLDRRVAATVPVLEFALSLESPLLLLLNDFTH